jgi:hypothetical protein
VPLPDEIQVQTIFTVAVLNGKQADAAATIVRLLTSTEAAAAYERSGAIASVRVTSCERE